MKNWIGALTVFIAWLVITSILAYITGRRARGDDRPDQHDGLMWVVCWPFVIALLVVLSPLWAPIKLFTWFWERGSGKKMPDSNGTDWGD